MEGIVGDRAKAIPAMRAYIAAMEGGAPVMIGSAHAYLSDMLHEEGRYDEALAAATEADKLLSANPVETVDARLRLARAELALGNFDSAQGLLDEVSALDVKVESSLVKLESLKLQLGLARSGQQELLSNYQELDAARARQETTRLSQRSGYYNARREAARKATELEGLQRRQALLEAQNIASEARAESAKQSRNLTLVSAASIVVLAALLGYLLSRRRFDRRFRNEQAALTEELESEVRVQSEALARRAHNEALGQLTGNVAHDFNNLLQVMSIANERLATESISDASHRLLQGSNEALSSARGIIGRLLAYARQQELDEQPISIPDFLDDARPLLEAALGTSVALEV
ncbi:MAG: tetratricopeptide repeat protein, partial [Pseudomonadota bacterium]